MEPFLPDSPDPLPKLLQPQAVARDAVVGKVPPKFLTELLVLLRHRPMPVAATPLGDPFETPTHALTSRLRLVMWLYFTGHFDTRETSELRRSVQ